MSLNAIKRREIKTRLTSADKEATKVDELIPSHVKQMSASMEQISWSSNSSLSSSSSSSAEISRRLVQPKQVADPVLRICGQLEKMSNTGLKLWHKRYFVLTDYILQYYSDPSKKKHHGTILLTNTYTRPTVKKDGTAHNKKYSFKVEIIRSNLNESEGKISSKGDSCFYFATDSLERMNELINYFNLASRIKTSNSNNRRPGSSSSNRSSSNHSVRVRNMLLDANEFMASQMSSANKRSNSAPNSPMVSNKKSITINESANTIHTSFSSNKFETPAHRSRSNNSLAGSKSIYDSFEKPLKHAQGGIDPQKTIIVNLVTNKSVAENAFQQQSSSNNTQIVMDREKIAAATMAANDAAIAAIEKEKEKLRMQQQQTNIDQTDKLINNFYNLSMSQMDLMHEIIKKLHIMKNQANIKEHQSSIHINSQLNAMNENMCLLHTQLDEFNLILTESLINRRQMMNESEHQSYLKQTNSELVYSHLFPSSNVGRGAFNVVKSEPYRTKLIIPSSTTSGFKPVGLARRDFFNSDSRSMQNLSKLSNNYYNPDKSNQVLLKPIPVKSYQPNNAENMIAKKSASLFKPELVDHCDNQKMNEFAEQNEMAYFDMKFTKELANLLYPEKDFKVNE